MYSIPSTVCRQVCEQLQYGTIIVANTHTKHRLNHCQAYRQILSMPFNIPGVPRSAGFPTPHHLLTTIARTTFALYADTRYLKTTDTDASSHNTRATHLYILSRASSRDAKAS